MFVWVVLLSQQYSIYLLNVCMCCPVISTVQYRSVKTFQVQSCQLNGTVQICPIFVGVVLLSQQYNIYLLNLCRCCPVIPTVQYRYVECLQVLSCFLNSTAYICKMFVGVFLLCQQYSIGLLNLCRCCPVISTVQYRSAECLQVLSCYLNSTVKIC